MKKVMSLILFVAIILSILPLSGATAAPTAAPEKDGYTLVPAAYGKTGVDVLSSFTLTTPLETTLEEIVASLSIDGQPEPDIVHKGGKEFVITPAIALSPNSLYVFRLQRDGKADVTWAFQTAKKFLITSNYPFNSATNVPRNTGIEITFSEEGYTPIDSFFSISPSVNGRFEYHKNTAVFIPARLDYRTVYTVTIKAGIKLEGRSEQLLTDYVFAFETEAEKEYVPTVRSYHESVYFHPKYTELPTIEAPVVGFRILHSRDTLLPNPKVNVYRFSSSGKALEAVKKILTVRNWTKYDAEEDFVRTYNLDKVMSFDAKDYYDRDSSKLSMPDKLSQGFYLITTELSDSRDQMIVQISDLPVQVVADKDKALVWVNDIGTGRASANATVLDMKEGRTYKTDRNGVAVIDRTLSRDEPEQLAISSTNGKTCIWIDAPNYSYYSYGGYRYNEGPDREAYWKTLQLDRTLFKRDDTVSFYGFVQERGGNEDIENVTAILTRGYGYSSFGSRDMLHRQVVPVNNGCYTDEMKLPNLETGGYNLTIYHGDIALSSTYFTVRDYVKPPYKIEVAANKRAAFAGEDVTFTTKASFFEGTPVSDLGISYNINNWWRGLITSGQGEAKTNLDGVVTVSEKIVPETGAQGEVSLAFMAEATLPEIGRTTKSMWVRAFINDIEVKAEATRIKTNATITVDVNSITLDRLNNGTAQHYYDYLDKPVSGKTLSVDIYRVYYEKTEKGSYYSFIEKKNITTYSYNRREEVINSFQIVTNYAGVATRQFTVPDRKYESYFARVICVDGNGRSISHEVYIGWDYSQFYKSANVDDYYLEGARKNYDLGEEVNLTLMRGTDEVTRGGFLFVTMQRGIQSYHAGSNPFTFKFARQHIPNITVSAYYFDGYKYHSNYNMSEYVRFDYSKNDLTLTAVMDKEAYKPGEMCEITVTAKDKDGNAKEANINISIVDEALFALSDYRVNTLTSLYQPLSTGLRLALATHRMYTPGGDLAELEPPLGAPAPSADSDSPENDGGDTYLREEFKDTAFFDTIRTNARGEAVYNFKLPDNITSWRLTMSGISNDLYAGNAVRNIIVTNPMFLSYTLNDEFLIGDKPTIGVNVYGTSLTGGETVSFEVWDENSPDVKYTASGVAFERINIPLWEMKNEGANALIIKATVSGGASDAVKHQFQIHKTYREIDEAVYYDLTTGTVFDVGSGGLTNITFTDRGRGQFLHQLLRMRYAYGDRIESLLVSRDANKMLKEYFPDLLLHGTVRRFDPKLYQRSNGGIAILPHAESDLETTVKLMPFIKDEININALKDYLYRVYEGDNADNKMCALYGLAMLYEPVLLDLDNYSQLDGLSVKDAVYIALGYDALGEVETASRLYDNHIAPYLEQITPYYRVNTGVDNDDILEATAAASLLATKLEKPQKDGLYQYCIRNHTIDILINVQRLSHIKHEIVKRSSEGGSITYTLFGEQYTRQLRNGRSYTLRIPARSLSEFKLTGVTGDVGAVSTYKKPMTEIGKSDDDITVKRRYYKENDLENSTYTFEQGDLVRVHLWIDYTAKAIDGSYCVTDYLPAGLEYVGGSAKISGAPDFGYGSYRYCTVDGQKVTFYDYNGKFNRGYLYYYYARVISPGTFTAEGPFVQNLTAKDYYTVGENSTITIK